MTHGLWGAAQAVALAVVGFMGRLDDRLRRGKASRCAVSTALLPICADAILANPAAVAQLKTKRSVDYDHVVRDHLKTVGNRTTDYTFWRACGKAIEARMTHAVVK
jgi:hypothetical protein